ncbi:hypothetical protein DPMN_140695 [Dreissena polymorpha]|uniref:Uncharacterized protein n=1 Tax=Dreissena polymorpha TaxID=45954 RepID=A0A9D4JJ88_DREPO|nr:hypothetical protein DPMN_140695 [Dreissena polymorpha]
MCDVTCGNGKVVKQRKCDSPAPKHGGAACPGDNVEVTNCKMANCPANTANSSAFGYGTEYKSVSSAW